MIRRLDIVIIVALLLLATLLFLLLHAEEGKTLVVEIDGRVVDRLSLTAVGEYTYQTEAGNVTVTISDHTGRVSASDCENLHCVRSGAIGHAGQSVICLPLRFCIYLSGDELKMDGITG